MWIFALSAMAAAYASSPTATAPSVANGPIAGQTPAPHADAQVQLDSSGHVSACTITKSSGNPALDKRTCDELRREVETQARAGTLTIVDGDDSWHADIVDLTDPSHPTCVSKSIGKSAGSPGCAAVLTRPDLSNLSEQAKQVVFFISVAQGSSQPYAGDPEWGSRISNAVTTIYSLDGANECVPVSFEPGHNPCDKFGTATKFSEEQRMNARKTTIQETLFVLPRGR